MTKTAEQFDAEADAILNDVKSEFAAFLDRMMARCTAFADELVASDISPTFKHAISLKLMRGVNQAIEAAGDER